MFFTRSYIKARAKALNKELAIVETTLGEVGAKGNAPETLKKQLEDTRDEILQLQKSYAPPPPAIQIRGRIY